MLRIFFCNFGLLLLASELLVLEGRGGFFTGVVFLEGFFFWTGFLGDGDGAGAFFGCGVGRAFGGAFDFFKFSFTSFLTGDESAELEFVLDALVLAPFFWGVDFAADDWEDSESELLESLSEEEDDELSLLLLELESSVVLD